MRSDFTRNLFRCAMRRSVGTLVALFTSVCVSACASGFVEEEDYKDVRLNELQFIGSHNSFKIQPDSLMTGAMIAYERRNASSDIRRGPLIYERLSYGHLPIEVQLQLGMRLFEFDLHAADPKTPFDPGAAYNDAFGEDRRYEGGVLPEIINDGRILVYHVRDHDFRSTCIELSDCLGSMATWSKENPGHLPVIIYLEAKSNGGTGLSLSADGLTDGTPGDVFGLEQWQRVQTDVEQILGMDSVYRPSQLARKGLNLRDSIKGFGWPYVDDLRGQFLFVVAGEDASKDAYSKITDPLFFTFRPIEHPDASFIIEFDPFSSKVDYIVQKGFIASTYADYMLVEARENNTRKRDRLFAAGAQMISTDFPVRDPRFSDYEVVFEGRTYVRPSPKKRSSIVVGQTDEVGASED